MGEGLPLGTCEDIVQIEFTTLSRRVSSLGRSPVRILLFIFLTFFLLTLSINKFRLNYIPCIAGATIIGICRSMI